MRLFLRRASLALALLVLAFAAAPAAAQRLQCDRCHGELELLRQRVRSLPEAERLLAPAAVLHASAHGDMACTECHSGIDRYPHSEGADTRGCSSCHTAADSAWGLGAHANVQDREPIGCRSCHGVHDVASIATWRSAAGIPLANRACLGCHEAHSMPAAGPHTGTVLCADCHGAHDVRPPTASTAPLHPLRQADTCGGCHEEIAERWREDVHADTLRALRAAGEAPAAEMLPGCTSCHDGHAMIRPDSAAFGGVSVERCAGCHEHAAETYYESYHGQAARLGSRAAAACADCHGAHGIRPSHEPGARTARANLVSTCGACHGRVSAGFIGYDSHPEPMNRARNPWVFYAFWSMNLLLAGTMTLWALHTGLWWLRLRRDRRGAHLESEEIIP